MINKDQLDIIYYIFERETKPPFELRLRKNFKTWNLYNVYNSDGKMVAVFWPDHPTALTIDITIYSNIKQKIKTIFSEDDMDHISLLSKWFSLLLNCGEITELSKMNLNF